MKMRGSRFAAAVTAVLALWSLGSSARAALQNTGSVADSFDSSSFSGNNGTMRFEGPWTEIGEADGPASGAVQVVKTGGCESGPCLEIAGRPDIRGVWRAADLSGATKAELSFAMTQQGGPAEGELLVRVSPDGGRTWTTLIAYPRHARTATRSLDLSAYASGDTVISFVATAGMKHLAHIDDVRIDIAYEEPSGDDDEVPTEDPEGPPDHADPQGKPHVTPTTAPPPSDEPDQTEGEDEDELDGIAAPGAGRLNDDVLIGIALSHRNYAPPAWTATERSLVRSGIEAADLSRAVTGSRTLRRDREPVTEVSATFTRTGPSLGSQLLPAALLGVLIAWATITGFETRARPKHGDLAEQQTS